MSGIITIIKIVRQPMILWAVRDTSVPVIDDVRPSNGNTEV